MTKNSKVLVLVTTLALLIGFSAMSPESTLAQGPQPGGRPSINVQAFNACTTTNYADLAAKALNMAVPDIRKAIVSGQSIQQIAATANISPQTVEDAVQTARNADIDQAVKDGVITQDEATTLKSPATPGVRPAPSGTRPAPNGTQAAPGNTPRTAQLPDISNLYALLQRASGGAATPAVGGGGARPGGAGGFGVNNGNFNLVKQYVTAATALNLKCADLVKTLITPPGKSVVNVASDQKIDPQTVSDALVKAYKDALAQDVTDGVITQAQADQLSPTVEQAVKEFIYNALPMGAQQPPR
jgi:hypothetical protein